MLYLLTGEDTAALRGFLVELKEKGSFTVSELSSDDASVDTVLTHYLSRDLFGGRKLIVLDLPSASKDYPIDTLFKKLKGSDTNVLALVLSSLTLAEKHIPLLNSDIKLVKKNFDYSQKGNSFGFVDMVLEGRRKDAYKEVSKLLSAGEDEFKLFGLLLYGIRNIAFSATSAPHFEAAKPFVKEKARKQAKRFDARKLQSVFSYLYDLDLCVKTGKLSPDMLLTLSIEKIAS